MNDKDNINCIKSIIIRYAFRLWVNKIFLNYLHFNYFVLQCNY